MPVIRNVFSDASDATEAYVIVDIDPDNDNYQVGCVGWTGTSDATGDVVVASFDPGGPTETPLTPATPYEIAAATMVHAFPQTIWAPKGLQLRVKFPISAPAAPDGTGEITVNYATRQG